MERREFSKAVGGGLCMAAVGGISVTDASAAGKPNIILCMADDQGWGDMAYNDHPVLKTPRLRPLLLRHAGVLPDSRERDDRPPYEPARGLLLGLSEPPIGNHRH